MAEERGGAADLVAETDTGARAPRGWQGTLITALCFVWALFQLYIASDLPFRIGLVVTSSDARLVHLAFAMTLAAFAFPLGRRAPRDRIPWYDWVLAATGIVSCLYIVVLRDAIATRAGLPTTGDLVISTLGMITLAAATYRALGLPLVIVAGFFTLYVFFGDGAWVPDVAQWKGASYGKAMWHYWMQNEGVFGVALAVSTSLIFLFVLFGAILEKSGAGNYFIKIAFALLGHLRGGPAKAAVMASAMSGLYSGSSIANTVTTGTFTIPLMKRTGFSAEKAGAVEVASSTNGQLTPPVMGAAAFLIAEFTGVSYTEIIKHALVPALVSYIALIYIVHLEALKMDLKGLPKPPATLPVATRLLGVLSGFLGVAGLGAAVYFGLGWIKAAAPESAFVIVLALCFGAYLALLALASRLPDLEVDAPDAPIEALPPAGPTALTGLHFLLPIVILIWCIIVERLSPGFSAFWATLAMIFVALTQHPIKALMRGRGPEVAAAAARGGRECFAGFIAGSRNMIGIGVATGAAGVIVGTISLTGAHQVVGELVEYLSGGNLMLMLVLVALMSLILGMGLPTTANYIVVSSLMAPVIVSLGAQVGLPMPLIAAHLFVFYFGILADDTPPVGLAAFAAAAISGGDPIKTGLQGFAYDIRTALLPFLFVFNTELLLIDVTPLKAVVVFLVAVAAMMLFAAATQGYFLARSRIWETAALLVIAFTLFRPGWWLDQVAPPWRSAPGSEAVAMAGAAPEGAELRLRVVGPDFEDAERDLEQVLTVTLPGRPGDGAARLAEAGLQLGPGEAGPVLEEPGFMSPYSRLGTQFDFWAEAPVRVETVQAPASRPPKEVFYLPALALLGAVIWRQRRRQVRPAF